jgi:predicted amino acid racemase
VSYIEINSNNILENLARVRGVCRKQGVSLTVVTKFFTSDHRLVRLLYDNGVDSIADTNIANFARRELPPVKKTLIKTSLGSIAALSGLPLEYRPRRLFVSDETLLEAVEGLPEGTSAETVLVAEAGDLRDGFYMEEIPSAAERHERARISGVAANFGCLSGKMPDVQVIRRLSECAAALPRRRAMPDVSIGGTVAYNLLSSGSLAGAATELRMGEGIFFGWDSSSGVPLEGFNRNTFRLYGEILEIREKMIAPIEGAGHTAFGGDAAPRKTGRRRCAVLDFGLLGASMYDLEPLDTGIEAVGQTYDFTVVDITESLERYKTGGFIPFQAMYAAAAHAFLNPYINRVLK